MKVGGAHFFSEEFPTGGEGAGREEDASAAEGPAGEARSEARVGVRVVYNIHLDGRVQMDWEIDARDALPAPLPPGLFK